MEDVSANVIIGNYVTKLHEVLNNCTLSKKDRNKEICKIAPKISNRENAFIQWQQLHEEEL